MSVNKKAIIIVSLIAVTGGIAGYICYRYYGRPTVKIVNIDWLNGSAELNVDGKLVMVQKGFGVILANPKYSITYTNVVSATGPANSIILLENGLPSKVVATAP